MAARCRSKEGLLTGGPKSLISWLTGLAASAYVTRADPVAANWPNSHNSSSGLCGARLPPICARRNPDSRAISSPGVTNEPHCPPIGSTT